MTHSDNDAPPRSAADVEDAHDLRSVIANALSARPVDEMALRRGVWTYVGAERHVGTSPGQVIMVLNDLIDAAPMAPPADRQALMRSVILWCVEAYFGHLGGDVVGRNGRAFSDTPQSS